MADEVVAAEPQAGVNATAPIDVKDAVKISMDYFKELFGSPFLDLSLEEVQKNPQGHWVVALGYTMARTTAGGTVAIPNYPRMYKQVTVDGSSGEVISMKVAKF
jgi:hypothetical protein